MSFLKKNKFESDWSSTLLHTPREIGIKGLEDALTLAGEDIINVTTGAADEAFKVGLEPSDARLLGRTYLVMLLAAKYPNRVDRDLLGPNLEQVCLTLAAKYGLDRVKQVRQFTEQFARFCGLAMPASPPPPPEPAESSSEQDSAAVGHAPGTDANLLGESDLEPIRPWFGQLAQTAETVINLARSAAESAGFAGYMHIEVQRRSAEAAVFFLWWAEKFVREQIPQPDRSELAAETLRALVSDDFPAMDLIGQQRYTRLSALYDNGATGTTLAGVPPRGMDETIERDHAVATLTSLKGSMIEELLAVWS